MTWRRGCWEGEQISSVKRKVSGGEDFEKENKTETYDSIRDERSGLTKACTASRMLMDIKRGHRKGKDGAEARFRRWIDRSSLKGVCMRRENHRGDHTCSRWTATDSNWRKEQKQLLAFSLKSQRSVDRGRKRGWGRHTTYR